MAEQKHKSRGVLKPMYGDKPLCRKPVSVLLPPDMDEFVRSRPNRTEWLRKAIAAQYQKDMAENHEQSA